MRQVGPLVGPFGMKAWHVCQQVRKLTAGRQLPNWDFSTLFLVKDSLAVMLESAGLLEDALREYTELEALFLTTAKQSGSSFGASSYLPAMNMLQRAYTSLQS